MEPTYKYYASITWHSTDGELTHVMSSVKSEEAVVNLVRNWGRDRLTPGAFAVAEIAYIGKNHL